MLTPTTCIYKTVGDCQIKADIYQPNYDRKGYNGWQDAVGYNADNNFWVRFDVTYDESIGITISDLWITNYSEYPVFLNGLKFTSGKSSVIPQYDFLGSEYNLPHRFGSDLYIPSPQTPFNGTNPIILQLEIGWTVTAGHGPTQVYPNFLIIVPDLPGMKYFIETGELPKLPIHSFGIP